jgi:RNA polymerase sigma-70 factor (ECF subfamily)
MESTAVTDRAADTRLSRVALTSSPRDGAGARLAEAARSGSSAAWQELYDRFFPKMYAYAYRRIGDSASAEDIAGEVFLEAYRRRKSFQYRGVPISAWLYRIAHNLSTNHLRRRNRIRFQPLGDEEPRDEFKAEDHEDAITTRDEVTAALRRLTPEQRHVVVLRFMEGMSRADVAFATGKSLEAVKALQHRALTSLRYWLRGTRNGGSGRREERARA